MDPPFGRPGCQTLVMMVGCGVITRDCATALMASQGPGWCEELTGLFARHFSLETLLVNIELLADVDSGYILAIVCDDSAGSLQRREIEHFVKHVLFGGLHQPADLPVSSYMLLQPARRSRASLQRL